MSDFKSSLSGLLSAAVSAAGGRWDGGTKASRQKKRYDKDLQKPVLKCSICNGEQVAGFKDIRTGKFEEVVLIRNKQELEDFMNAYGIDEITKEY